MSVCSESEMPPLRRSTLILIRDWGVNNGSMSTVERDVTSIDLTMLHSLTKVNVGSMFTVERDVMSTELIRHYTRYIY